MKQSLKSSWQRSLDYLFSDSGTLILIAVIWVILLALVNGRYGFHRDELAFLDNSLHLDWGFVEYPPLVPAIARFSLGMFGQSLAGLRAFSALAIGMTFIISGWMARELGGKRWAQIITALSVAIAPIAFSHSSLFTYETFDYLWWVLTFYLVLRLLRTNNPRLWIGIGISLGLGMMTKYTIAFLALGIIGGVIFTPARRYLKSHWLWGGILTALIIFLPNMIWQGQHHFISLEFLKALHSEDIGDLGIGRTGSFLVGQFYICASISVIYFWITGFRYFLFSKEAGQYRMIGWMVIIPFILFLIGQGRFYYMAPVYPVLLAAGVTQIEIQTDELSAPRKRSRRSWIYPALAIGGIASAGLTLPLATVNTWLWNVANGTNQELREEIGWPELVDTVAAIKAGLPPSEQSQVGILAGNYGEAAAIDLLGPARGLPEAISGVDTYGLRQDGKPIPPTVIVLGMTGKTTDTLFRSCSIAGKVTNRYGIANQESRDHPDIYLCRDPILPWTEFWKSILSFG
jgi:4-amino-4-deoxy-L-arabinose transferase-like glycosyltransferase